MADKLVQTQQIHLPRIPCLQNNHFSTPFQYVCLSKECLKYNKFLLCYYCMQDTHKNHLKQIVSLSYFINECLSICKPKTQQFNNLMNVKHQEFYKLEKIFINGVAKCKTKQQLNGILQQIYKATFVLSNRQKNENLLNNMVKETKMQIEKFYTQNQKNKYQSSNKQIGIRKPLTKNTDFSIPVVSFDQKSVFAENYTFLSPFQIKHTKSNKISSNLTYPPLTTFNQSVQVFIKILRITPNWLGIGIAIGQTAYTQQSKSHITLLSNGWLNTRGTMIRVSKLKFHQGQTISIKWDKCKKQLIFRSVSTRNQQTVKFNPQWNQQIFICVNMFFNDDSIAIVQSAE